MRFKMVCKVLALYTPPFVLCRVRVSLCVHHVVCVYMLRGIQSEEFCGDHTHEKLKSCLISAAVSGNHIYLYLAPRAHSYEYVFVCQILQVAKHGFCVYLYLFGLRI